jgi:hypothetical protein
MQNEIKYHSRDVWLTVAVGLLNNDVFDEAGIQRLNANWRISCSWPGGGSARKRVGECWPSGSSDDATREMFISPVEDDAMEVLGIVAHEMIHAIDDCKHGHRGPFRKMALAIGLEGKMTATKAGPELTKKLEIIANILGPYPHAKLNLNDRKKQTTRMIKMTCNNCGFIARASRRAIGHCGYPTCGCGNKMA